MADRALIVWWWATDNIVAVAALTAAVLVFCAGLWLAVRLGGPAIPPNLFPRPNHCFYGPCRLFV